MINYSAGLKLVIFSFVAGMATVVGAAEGNQPNILWIFSEDLSPYMGCYEDPVNRNHTPTIDALASQGVLFRRAYMPAPVCSACRSAMITGVMQTTTGTHQHRSSRAPGKTIDPEVFIELPVGMKTIPELMREAGYFTFNSGKDDYNFHYDRRKLYSVGTRDNYKPGMNGWQGNFARHSGSFTEDTWRACADKDQPWFGQIMIWGGKAGPKHVRKGEKLADRDVPIPPYFPDTPAHRKSWTTHYNAARGADAQIQEILDLLKADGELENTIVFFFSDHGNNQSLRHKQFCYEGGVHVPLMIKGKHPALQAGTVREDLVSGLDIAATTLTMGGAKLPDYLDGHDLFAPDFVARDFVISARDRCDYTIDRIRTVRSDKLRYIRNYFPERTMLQPQYRDHAATVKDLKRLHADGKLTDYQDRFWFGVRPEEELYDIAKDPYQIHNLAADPAFASELERHRKILADWISKTGDKGQQPEDPVQLKATFDLWKDRPIFRDAKVNPEYDQFRE
jgi:arylsulfatase A-like enzyme